MSKEKKENINGEDLVDIDENSSLSKETINSEQEKVKEDKDEKINEEKNFEDSLDSKSEESLSKNEDDKEKDIEPLEDKKIPPKKKKIIIISICVVVAMILIFFGGIICINKMNLNVYKNVYVLGIDMSGKTADEVSAILDKITLISETEEKSNDELQNDEIVNSIKNKLDNRKIDIYQEKESIYTVVSGDIEFSIDVAKTVENVMTFGRNKNIFVNNFEILKAYFSRKDIEVAYKCNEQKLDEICKNIELTLKNRFVDDKYSIDHPNKKLVITRGITGNTINIQDEKDKILEYLCSGSTSVNDDSYSLQLTLINKRPNSINIDDIYKELKKEPKDAYIDKESNPVKLVEEELGYDINLEEVKALLNLEENKQEGKEIEIPITVLQPKVKLADISYTLYKDKLAGYTTYFDPGQAARANNLAIALNYLNGKVIMPGQIFSYNAAIGDTTVAKGYKAAATFKGGTVVQELGGGICQTTSTLYNVALMANLEIVERHQHGLPVGYVPPSRDATVYSPSLDFKFKNTRKYPVKIVTSFSNGGSLNISIFGTKEEKEYEVILSHKYLSTIPFTTKYEYDNTIPDGTQVVKSGGVNGYTSESYITKKLNGVVTYSGILSKDRYNAQQQIVKIGTKKAE